MDRGSTTIVLVRVVRSSPALALWVTASSAAANSIGTTALLRKSIA